MVKLVAWVMIALYAFVFSVKAILRHAGFNSNAFDLGLFDQSVWNTLQGRIFFYTTTGEPLLHLSNHADFILLLLAPFYLIYSGPETLLVLQALAIALGGLPIFWLARERLDSGIAALSLLAAYLLFPGLELVTLRDFHPPGLATGFLMFAFYFMLKARLGGFLIFSTLAMMCKEQIPLLIVFMGLYALLVLQQWRLGSIAIIYGLIWFWLVIAIVIPAYSITGEHLFLNYYAYLGNSPTEIIINTITRPDIVLQQLWQPTKLQYFLDLMVPFGFLPLIGLPVLLIGTPAFAINLLSTNEALHSARVSHYIADVAPWVAWGAVFGVIYLTRGLGRFWPKYKPQIASVIGVALFACALTFHYYHGYSPLSPTAEVWTVTRHDHLAQRFIDQIPPDAAISAQGALYPHVSNRVIAYQFPHIREAEYIFLDASSRTWPMHPNDHRTEVKRLLNTGNWGILDAADGYLLLKRGNDNTSIPQPFYDFAYTNSAAPQHPAAIEFDEQLTLIGYDVIDMPRQKETVIRLYWQALTPIEDSMRLYPFFIDTQGRIIETIDERPLISQVWHPPQDWQPGKIVVAETLPTVLGDGPWSLAIGVLKGSDWEKWEDRAQISRLTGANIRAFENRSWARVGTFERQRQNLVAVPIEDVGLSVPNPTRVNFDQKMALIGYELLPETVNVGEVLSVKLYWEALAKMPIDYTIFVHLIDSNGQTVAQHDGQPFWQVSIPTTTWQLGEQLIDQHDLLLPENLPSGDYQLYIGAYFWQTLERLPVIEDNSPIDDHFEISGIRIND